MSYTNQQIKIMIGYKEKEVSNSQVEKDLFLERLQRKEQELMTAKLELKDLEIALDILEKCK